jgi:hypothetical protein
VLPGLAVSDIGTIMLYTTLPFYVFVRTGCTLATGAMFVAQLLPRILVGSLAGYWSTAGRPVSDALAPYVVRSPETHSGPRAVNRHERHADQALLVHSLP